MNPFAPPMETPGLLANLLNSVDALFIFTADHRTIHDHLAGTRVVKVPRPRPAAPT